MSVAMPGAGVLGADPPTHTPQDHHGSEQRQETNQADAYNGLNALFDRGPPADAGHARFLLGA
jgi:hypothetical protein